jgi:hypothetical protein
MYNGGDYLSDSGRGVRGGSLANDIHLMSSVRTGLDMNLEGVNAGVRVASVTPEPCTLVLFGLGGLVLRRRKSQ